MQEWEIPHSNFHAVKAGAVFGGRAPSLWAAAAGASGRWTTRSELGELAKNPDAIAKTNTLTFVLLTVRQ